MTTSTHRFSSTNYCYQPTVARPDSIRIPDSGDYEWMDRDGTSTTLTFDNQGGGSYNVMQRTIESDGTRTNFNETITVWPTLTRRERSISVTYPYYQLDLNLEDGLPTLFIISEGNNIIIILFEDIQQELVDRVEYTGGTITGPNGTVFATNVTTLRYFDGLRFYEFTRDTINDLPGPGMLYYNPNTSTALYSNNLDFNTQLDTFIRSTNSTVPPVTPSPSTVPPSPNSVDLIAPPPITAPPVTLPPITAPPITLPPSTAPPITLPPSTDLLSIVIGTIAAIIIIISFVSLSCIIVCCRIYKRRKLLTTQHFATDNVLR